MKKIKLDIFKSTGVLVFEDCDSVTLPALSGTMEIRPGHEEMVINLGKGEIVVKIGDQIESIDIKKGSAIIESYLCQILLIK